MELEAWLPGSFGEAVSIRDIRYELEVSRKVVYKIVQHHRQLFGTESLAILCDYRRPRYVYWLSRDPKEINSYDVRRTGDMETRIRTIKAIAERSVNFADGRTLEGRRARRYKKYLTRLLEDVDELLLED
jgi:hypothetical protein